MEETPAATSPESVVLEMDLPELMQLLDQLGQPSSPASAACLRQRVGRGETVDQILESFSFVGQQRRAA